MQLCTLRYLGFAPDSLHKAPTSITVFLSQQLGVSPESLNSYGERSQTRTDHLQEIESYLGFHRATPEEKSDIERWLVERALEHDRPLLLLQMLCERLQALKLVRPGVTLLERAVTKARQEERAIIWQMVASLLTNETKAALDKLLVIDEQGRRTLLHWLRTGATSHSAGAILGVLEKIVHLRGLGVEQWDLSSLNPNRLKRLAQRGRTFTNQALERMAPERRYPILLAFLHQTLTDAIDETVDLFDRYLTDAYARAGRELHEFRQRVARATNEKVRLFQMVGRILLNLDIPDAQIRALIYQQIRPEELEAAVAECEQIMRPPDDSYFDLLATRYSNLRQARPTLLGNDALALRQ